MVQKEIVTVERVLNTLGVLGAIVTIFIAFAFQILFDELPCPLCLLQRMGFFGIALGFLLNLRFGLRPSHYAIVLLSGLFTTFVALRQIALHVVPGTGSYGSPIFGLHLYTWSFIVAALVLVTSTLMMGFDRQYFSTLPPTRSYRMIVNLLFMALLVLVAINIVAVISQCGLGVCPDNPLTYKV